MIANGVSKQTGYVFDGVQGSGGTWDVYTGSDLVAGTGINITDKVISTTPTTTVQSVDAQNYKGNVTVLDLVSSVLTKGMIGNISIANLNLLVATAATGDAYAMTDGGTPTQGISDALVAGSITEWDGTQWKELATGSTNPPANASVVVHATATLNTPFAGSARGKQWIYTGSSFTPNPGASTVGNSWLIDAGVDAGDIIEYDGTATTVTILGNAGGFVPVGTTCFLTTQTGKVFLPWTRPADNGRKVTFDGTDNVGTLGYGTVQDTHIVSGSGTDREGDLIELNWERNAKYSWHTMVANVGGFPPLGTQVLAASSDLSLPLTRVDETNLVTFDGTSFTPSANVATTDNSTMRIKDNGGTTANRSLLKKDGKWTPWPLTLIRENVTVNTSALVNIAANGIADVNGDEVRPGARVLVKDNSDTKQVSSIDTIADATDSLDGTFWVFYTTRTVAYYVWYDTPAGAGDPNPTPPAGVSYTGIQVTIIQNEPAANVASKTKTEIDLVSFPSGDPTVGITTNQLTLTLSGFGSTQRVADGSTPTGFTIGTDTDGGLALENGVWLAQTGIWTRPDDWATGMRLLDLQVAVIQSGATYKATFPFPEIDSFVDTDDPGFVELVQDLATTNPGFEIVEGVGARVKVKPVAGLSVDAAGLLLNVRHEDVPISGTPATSTLSAVPMTTVGGRAALLLTFNGAVLAEGADYTMVGTAVVTWSATAPTGGDVVNAFFFV
jgi:hypothetical protein